MMDDLADKAKGVLMAFGLLMLLAWPFLGLAYTMYLGK